MDAPKPFDPLEGANFTYTSVTNLQWADADMKYVNCTVKFDRFSEPLPYTACREDITLHCMEIFQRAVAGDFGPIKPYSAPAT